MKNPKLSDMVVSAVASELGTRRDNVKALILSGALVAYDCSPPGAKRKSYRITREALDNFKAGRSAKQTKPGRRVKHSKPENFVEYFS